MKKRHTHIKWSLIDLTRPASELAEELGVAVATIYRKRKELGVIVPNMSGGKIGNKGGAPIGNQHRKGTGHNMANLNIRLPETLLADVRRAADKRGMNVSEFARQAFLLLMKGPHNGAEEKSKVD